MGMDLDHALNGYGPRTQFLARSVAQAWPEHEDYLMRRFCGGQGDIVIAETVAEMILRVLGQRLGEAIENYRWTCHLLLTHEYRFEISGRYMHSSFSEVRAAVYDDPQFMSRYTDGLLISQLLWANHSASIASYHANFLTRLRPNSELLEVGPGHGLLLALAAAEFAIPVTGWDISETSVEATRLALEAMGAEAVVLRSMDLMAAPTTVSFDAVVASELLEHLEDPVAALLRLKEITRLGGLLFLNIPVNSPAPDHIYMWTTPEEVLEFVVSTGLKVLDTHVFPLTGKTETQARAAKMTISCVLICQRH
jgi:2-polyprenyl-3-methyl-5-hydroxy-6-metoxy-1,4-benzoquinol methylase